MLNYIQALQDELNNTGLLPVFELEVINKDTVEKDYITCDIFFKGRSLVCHRNGLTPSELNSKFIATSRVIAIKGDTLDCLLEDLHSEIVNDIIDSPLYDLTNA